MEPLENKTRRGWIYSEKPLDREGYVYMGRVPDPKKGEGTHNTVKAYAPSTKLKKKNKKSEMDRVKGLSAYVEKNKPKSNKSEATPKVEPLIYESSMRGEKLIGGKKDAPQWLKDLDTLVGRLLTGGITQGTKPSSKPTKSKKAKGGYVKKYARGGGVRKVRS
mgnify:FL=1|jgi:hypothetical protein|tara:strand:+ start:84 stop:572 length:489 start_codon:yes stop_codon:yes gene_type:complete